MQNLKTVFEKHTREELISRIHRLTDNDKPLWGRMTVYQMVKHCRLWEEMMQSKTNLQRSLIGKLFGKLALKSVLKDASPLQKNTPTVRSLVIQDLEGDLEGEKSKWIDRIENYEHFSNPGFVHVFFGKMNEEQIGRFVYKHIDHHLRQFNR